MSTLVQIETAVTRLSPEEQRSLMEWLQGRLTAAPSGAEKADSEALKAFRKLQCEVGLTAEAAAEWKAAVKEARW